MIPNLLNTIRTTAHASMHKYIYSYSLGKTNTANTVTVHCAVYTAYSSIQLLRALRRWVSEYC